MTARYYDAVGSEDSVRLLSNPLNDDLLQSDECEHTDDIRTNNVNSNYCLTCHSASSLDTVNPTVGYVDNDHLVSQQFLILTNPF